MSELCRALDHALHAINWQSHGYFITFYEGFTFNHVKKDGTVVFKNEEGCFAVDDDLKPVGEPILDCRQVVRMTLHNAQLFALSSSLVHKNIPLLISDPEDLWMIPLLCGFNRRYICDGINPALLKPLVQAGHVLNFFLVTYKLHTHLFCFKQFTMEQQELVMFLYYDFGCNEEDRMYINTMECTNDDLWIFFKGIHFHDIFDEFCSFYRKSLTDIIAYYRSKQGQRLAYAAFFHNLDTTGVPASNFRRMVGHGAGRFQIRKRVCFFLYFPQSGSFV
jgi:hypothetical protein